MKEHSFVDKHQFSEDILKILDRGSTNDVEIKLSDGEIVANKDILMARSEYFATMLGNNKFVEGETGSVDMSHCSKLVMEKIIKFLFSGEVSFDQMSLAHHLELIHMTDMMLLTEFKDRVEDFVVDKIESSVTPSEGTVQLFPELISGLRLADQYNLTEIKEAIIHELHFDLRIIPDHVKASDSFKTLPFNFIKDIFLCVCMFDTPSALLRLKAFMVWLSQNEVTEEQQKEIVDSFNLEEFSAEELLTEVRDSGLFSAKKIDERMLELLKEKELKIEELRNSLVDAKRYVPLHLRSKI